MSAIRRFFNSDDENSIFRFTIDTNKIVSGATNGSENPLTFRLPLIFPTAAQTFIVRVSDGRPDFAYASNPVITFSTPGIYTITLIGRVLYFYPYNVTYGYDRLKLLFIENWGNRVMYGTGDSNWERCFEGCTNLIIRATNGLKFPSRALAFFVNIKGFDPVADLSKYDVSQTANLPNVTGITLPMYSVFNPFLNVVVNMTQFYQDVNMSNVPKIEIISPTLVGIQQLLKNSGFQGRLIVKAALTNIIGVFEGITNPPSLGEVDVRVIVNVTNFITSPMSTANVDATLLGWAALDWAGYPNNVRTFNFLGSKYSNNSNVIAARAFLISKGFTFNNLTMV